MAESVVHLSSVVGSPLLDCSGERLGRVEDVIARLDTGDELPSVTGFKARIGGRELFVPADRIARLEPQDARTSTTMLDLAQFERRPGEVLLRADVLGRSMIDVNTARLVKAREVELVCDAGIWRVAGIDPALGAGIRRFLPRRFAVTSAITRPLCRGRRSSRSWGTCRRRGCGSRPGGWPGFTRRRSPIW